MESSVVEALKSTPKGKLSYSPQWDNSTDSQRLELIKEWLSPPAFSESTLLYLARKTSQPSPETQPPPPTSSPPSSPTSSSPSSPPLPHSTATPGMLNSPPPSSSLPPPKNKTENISRGRLELSLDWDSPPPLLPLATTMTSLEITSTPKTPPTVAMEMSVLEEQQLELALQEQSLEDRLWKEKEERLAERRAFISRMKEKIERDAEEDRLRAEEAQWREQEVERAMIDALHKQRMQEREREVEMWAERYRQYGEELEAKLKRGVEQKKEIQKRTEERKRQAVQRLYQVCQQMKENCGHMLRQFKALHDSCPFPQHLPTSASDAYQRGCGLLQAMLSSLDQLEKAAEPEETKVTKLHSLLLTIYPLLVELSSGVREAVQRGQQEAKEREEQQKQQEEQQKQQEQHKQQQEQKETEKLLTVQQSSSSTSASQSTSAEPTTPSTLGIPQSRVKLYSSLQETLSTITAASAPLLQDPQLKKYRFDLQKAVSTPVNAISSQSGNHLVDKIERLRRVLSGQAVQVTGRGVSAATHPQGKNYCFNLLAQKIVKQGEEQVSSRSEAAFPIAGVAVSLCLSFPQLGQLILAHFHASCPVLVPFYIPKSDGMTEAEHYRLQGFKVSSSGQVETEDNYLRRVSGMVRLYSAILQTPTDPRPHPHGLEHAWGWFARVLNMPPHPSLSSTAIYDMLEITGHALLKKYGKQFQKILYVLCKEYLPLVEKVTPPSQKGPYARLRLFLEECVSTGNIAPPKGVLTHEFWRSHSRDIVT